MHWYVNNILIILYVNIDIDQCSLNNGGCYCHSMLSTDDSQSVYNNTMGSFTGLCSNGYQLRNTTSTKCTGR